MKFLASLAWKNLSRYKKRTFITAITIAVGIAMFIWVDAWLLGADKDSMRNLVWFETGSAQILDSRYWEDRDYMPLKYAVDNPERVMSEVEELGYEAAPRTVFSAELLVYEDPYPTDGSLQVRVSAIDPQLDPKVFELDKYVVEGRYLEEGENGILLGIWLADKLNAKVGYPVTVVTRTKDGAYQTFDLEVVGILNTPNPIVNRINAYMPLDTADSYLYMEGSVTQVTVHFPDTAALAPTIAGIENAVDGDNELTVKSWKQVGEDFVAMSTAKSAGSKAFLFLIFIIAAVGISNTMLMAVYERIRELGMMRAMGMKDGQIRTTFMFEAAGIGLIGAGIGLAIGVLLTFWVVNWGVDLSLFVQDMDIGYRVSGIFRGAWNPGTMVTAFIAGIVLSTVVAWIPAGRALKKEITECLRHQ